MVFAGSYSAAQVIRIEAHSGAIETTHHLGILTGGRELIVRIETDMETSGFLEHDASGFPEMYTQAYNKTGPISGNYHPMVQTAAITDLKDAFAAVAPGPFCVAFGHMGDGNLHAFARPYDEDPKDHPKEADAIKAALRDTVVKWNGSISAEHGVGQDKQAEMKQLKDPIAYEMMKSIKATLDPDNILNPGKVLL